jgi:hypothetical protein
MGQRSAKNDSKEYKVKWKHWGHRWDSWEPAAQFAQFTDLLHAYEAAVAA